MGNDVLFNETLYRQISLFVTNTVCQRHLVVGSSQNQKQVLVSSTVTHVRRPRFRRSFK